MCSMDVDTLPGNLKVAAVWILHLGFLSVVDMMAPMSGRMVMEFKARRNKIILKPSKCLPGGCEGVEMFALARLIEARYFVV